MRFDWDRYKEIIDTLSRNRSRTLLTGFGIFWGIFMLLVMLGGGNGLKSILKRNFDGFTTNAVICGTNQTSKPYGGFKRGRFWDLNKTDVAAIKEQVTESDVVTMLVHDWSRDIRYGDKSFLGAIKGMDSEYIRVETPVMKFGRWLNDVDCAQERKVCVLGKQVWESLFPGGEDPTGKYVKIKNSQFRVIGVDFRISSMGIGSRSDWSIVIPYPVMDKMNHLGGRFDVLCLTVKKGASSERMQEKVRGILYRRHMVAPDDKDALLLVDTQKLFSIVDNLFKGVNILVILVGLGTLFAGAIGVSNIMMVTVKERTTEIGIRRAIGATPKMILSQIIAESIGLTVLAGMLGILFSVFLLFGLGTAISAASETGAVSFQIGFWTGILVLVLLVALGVLAGLAPALRAMSVKPVDAMRDE